MIQQQRHRVLQLQVKQLRACSRLRADARAQCSILRLSVVALIRSLLTAYQAARARAFEPPRVELAPAASFRMEVRHLLFIQNLKRYFSLENL